MVPRDHRFPRAVILLPVRWYCRYPLCYRDVRDLLAERGITVEVATVYRRVQKFGPESRQQRTCSPVANQQTQRNR